VANVRRNEDRYVCQPCLQENHLTSSKTVDHIVPIHVRPDWRLELGNTQVICTPCHQQDGGRHPALRQHTRGCDAEQQSNETGAMLIEPPRREFITYIEH
jgi:5-methylcytosine-specific restriction endonuclease McrA